MIFTLSGSLRSLPTVNLRTTYLNQSDSDPAIIIKIIQNVSAGINFDTPQLLAVLPDLLKIADGHKNGGCHIGTFLKIVFYSASMKTGFTLGVSLLLAV